jgi:hypothetical protein
MHYASGNSITSVKVHTAGYVTSGGKAVKFIIPLSKPPIGCSDVTVSTVRGFLLRQNNKYTHGSQYSDSGSTYAIPSSYSSSELSPCRNYVIVVAAFSVNTDAVNNSPIGVDVELKLTFS